MCTKITILTLSANQEEVKKNQTSCLRGNRNGQYNNGTKNAGLHKDTSNSSFKVNKTDIENNRVNKILTNNKICVQRLQSSL
jgi:hypothetical protein